MMRKLRSRSPPLVLSFSLSRLDLQFGAIAFAVCFFSFEVRENVVGVYLPEEREKEGEKREKITPA